MSSERTPAEVAADEEIDRFDNWFQGLGNTALLPFERAAIKAFVYWRTKEAKKEGPPGPPPQG